VEASLRWFQDDIIHPVLEVRDGQIELSEAPGLGFEIDESKLRKYMVRSERFGR
jgi:L-alanine-DL-glutamate epimerase-like enolase superfamily enzyme